MKRIVCLLLFTFLLISGCSKVLHREINEESVPSSKNGVVSYESSKYSNDFFVQRQDDQLLLKGEPIQLQAINFDNLTWYQETHLDGKPVFLLHHTEEDYDQIQSLGFNSIRYFIRWQDLFVDPVTCEKQEEGWKWLDQNISWAKERGIFLILDFHCPYGGFGTQGADTWPIWTDEAVQNSFLTMWKIIAETCSNETSIAAYDLMNEPTLSREGKSQYIELLESVISVIREEDPNHVIIVEAAVGIEGDEASFSKPTWVEVSDQNIMYSFHFYEPIRFTHQLNESESEKLQYPCDEFTQEDLRIALNKFIEEPFLKKYPLFLGEFGCNDWSEGSGSEQWITDVYTLCEEKSIHTALFVYRSFEDVSEKDEYSFAIRRVYLQADTESGTEESDNLRLLQIFPRIFACD